MASTPDPVGGGLGKILRDFKYELILPLVVAELEGVLSDYLRTGRIELEPIPEGLANIIAPVIGEAERVIGQPLFELLVTAPTGVKLSREPGSQEGVAVSMVERMLGFAIALPYGIARIKMLLEATMGENAAKGIVEALEKIPEEIGIGWALGSMMERIMEVASARPIEEAIAEQTRPQRIEWQQLRALARMHTMDDKALGERLARAGWRDEDIPLLSQLDRQRLSLGDVQTVYLHALKDKAWVADYLKQLGFDGEDNDLAMQVYIERAETAGGDMLRSVAQRAYMDDHITEAQWREYLVRVHVPTLSIDLEAEAIRLAKQQSRRQLSVGEIKQLHADNVIDDAQARKRLVDEGYTDDDAVALIASWNHTKTIARTGISEHLILSYLVSGVLTPAEAYDRLVALNIRPEDATFLVAHPSAAGPAKSHGASEATIVSAYKDGIIDLPTAEAKLAERGLNADAVLLTTQVAAYVKPRGPKAKRPPKELSEAHILAAFHKGLATSAWAVRELVTIGYSEPDAQLLVAIEETPTPTSKVPAGSALPDGWVVLT